MKNIKKLLLLAVLMLLMLGITSASEVSTDTADNTVNVAEDTMVTSQPDTINKQTNTNDNIYTDETPDNKNKQDITYEISKDNNNANNKKAGQISTWDDLVSEVNNAKSETQDVTITLSGETLTNTATITWNGNIKLTIDGNGAVIEGNQEQVFRIDPDSHLILKNITIQHAHSFNGGAIENDMGTLEIINSTIQNNTATQSGAILNSGKLNITDSTIQYNTASGSGGAIVSYAGTLRILNCTFQHNIGDYGGAIYNDKTLNIRNSTFINNTATSMGGAIENGNQATIRNTNFTNNTANEIAGAIDNQGLLNMSNCTLQYNNAKDCAGAIMDNNRAYVTNCTLEYNKAKYGGAIYTNKTLNLAGSNFTQNNATRQGGAIYLGSTNTINVNNSRFMDNDAGNGSGIYGVSGSKARINNSLFVNNTRPTLSVSNALTNTTIIERKIPTRITVNTDETVRLGDTINIHGYLEDISNESYLSGMDILITINDEQSHAATDENGYYELSYLTESIGTNIITVIYEGNDEYDAADCQTSVEVTKAEKIETHMSITVDNNDGTIIKAYLTDNDGNNVTGGKVAFKVNGKTLKNANGKVIYANVAEGIASVEWTVPEECYDKDVTISASYSGTGTYNQTKANITTSVATRQASISIDMPDTAQAGSAITITATITDGDRTVNTGKVIFKINGKTLKDDTGKVIYMEVSNNVASLEYVLPENMKAKEYTLTAVFISTGYERLEDDKTLLVTS